MDGKTSNPSQAGQPHPADNLDTQLAAIMVNIGRIVNARKAYPDRADTIIANSTKKIRQSTESFHMTLDDMENEITRAKAVFLRDLQALRDKKQAAQQAAAPVQPQPPAPMVVELDTAKPSQPSAPVAPMMAVGSATFPNRPALKVENNPVAPFPDMGMGATQSKPVVTPFGRAKPPVEQTRPSPKQPTPKTTPKPAPKSNPPSGRLANKPNPMANAQKQVPKPPATAPPSASAVAPAPAVAAAPPAAAAAAPPAPAAAAAAAAPVAAMSVPVAQPAPNMSSNPAPQSTFTNATFTVDPSNNDLLMHPGGGQDLGLDMPMLDMDSFANGGASGSGPGPAETANMDMPTNQNNNKDNNDSTMTDLDHFFDMGGDSSTSFDDNFNNIDDYINNDFTFDTFQ